MPLVDRLTAPELGAWRGMLTTHARVVAVLDAELREAHDLSLVEYEVLMYLLDAPGHRLRMSELADELIILSRSGLTRLVDRLEKRRTWCAAARAPRMGAASSRSSHPPGGSV